MYGFTNSDGEPIMDGAAWRYEQALDSMYEPDPYGADDDYYGYGGEDEVADPLTCEHGDGSYPEHAGYDCDLCCETFEGPRTDPDDVFWSRMI